MFGLSLFHQIATRKAYGMALAKLGRYNDHVVALDGDTKNSTFAELFKNEHPNRFVECYIAEQNMVRNRQVRIREYLFLYTAVAYRLFYFAVNIVRR